MLTLCFCRRFRIDPEEATFVKNGIPLCSASTCQKVKEHREAGMKNPHNDPGDETAWHGDHDHGG